MFERKTFFKYLFFSIPIPVLSIAAFLLGVALTFTVFRDSLTLIEDGVGAGNGTHPLAFVAERTAWVTIHFVENYDLSMFFTTSIMRVLDKEGGLRLFWLACNVVGIGFSLAIVWETIEAVGTVAYELSKYYGLDLPLPDGAIANALETLPQVLINDGVQGITGPTLAVITVVLGVVPAPPSFLLRRKAWWQIALRVLLYGLQLMDFSHVFQVSVLGFQFRIMFHALLFWKLFCLWLYYVDDLLTVCNGGSGMTVGQLNWTYAYMAIFHAVMWASLLGLHVWPLVTSNLFAYALVLAAFVVQVARRTFGPEDPR